MKDLLLYSLLVRKDLSSQGNLGDNEINTRCLDLECNHLAADGIDYACLFREIFMLF